MKEDNEVWKCAFVLTHGRWGMGQGDGQKNIPKETIQKGLEIKEIMTCTELEFKRKVVKGEKFI